MKYDFDLSLEEHTSLGKIIAQIDDHSSVLEFGPGNGRMTQYLVTEKKCDVSIVEFDEELYRVVMQFASDGFLGNIDDFSWVKYFGSKQFDYIIFADVLEHLTNTEAVLKKAKDFLTDSGRLLITFPNLAHNSVLIGLFNNELDWKEYGLLDQTHNTFFTQHGFESMFNRVGLHIDIEDFTYSQVGQNEIDTNYNQLPIPSRFDFRSRLFGEVYQYFYSLSKREIAHPTRFIPQNSNFVKEIVMTYQYSDKKESGMFLFNNVTGENKTSTHKITDNVKSLTINPLKGAGIVYFKASIGGKSILPDNSNFVTVEKDLYLFAGNESQPFFEFFEESISGKTLMIEIDIISEQQFYEIENIALSQSIKYRKNVRELTIKNCELSREFELQEELLRKRYLNFSDKLRYDPLAKLLFAKETLIDYKIYNDQLDNKIKLNIESIEIDEDESKTIIKGWGFNTDNFNPIIIEPSVSQGSTFKFSPSPRQDVIESFKLPEGDYGFILEINDFLVKKIIKLIVTDGKNQWQYKFNRFNLNNSPVSSRLRRVLGSIRRNGPKATFRNYRNKKNNQNAYDIWIGNNENYDFSKLTEQINAFNFHPKISIVIPVYNVEEKWLLACINSLKDQIYDNWELCLADDASTETYIKPLLARLASEDSRIKVVFREQNGHISEATNSAIGLATGDYIGFMDNDDELAPNALFEIARSLNNDRTIDFIYTDEDKITTSGKRFDPFFKPNWNEELLLGHNYITHFVVVKKELLVQTVGGLRHEYNGSQDYDFVLRATEKAQNIHHISKILYHWRTVETSTALDPKSKEYAYIAGEKAVQEALNRRNVPAVVKMTQNYGAYKVDYQFDTHPLVSIISIGDETNIGSWVFEVLKTTSYQKFEILIPEKFKSAIDIRDKRINYVSTSDLNDIVKKAGGIYLLFLNEQLVPKNEDWLSEMVQMIQRKNIGIVTGKIISAQETILNIGLTLNSKKRQLDFDQHGASTHGIGYYFRPVLPREVFVTTADAILIEKNLIEELGYFDLSLPNSLLGVDLSLRLRKMTDKKIIFQPYSELLLNQSDIFEKPISLDSLTGKFSEDDFKDPYVNENFFLM